MPERASSGPSATPMPARPRLHRISARFNPDWPMHGQCPKCARTGVSWTARRSCSRRRARACPRRSPIWPCPRPFASPTGSASPSPISSCRLVGDIEDELRSALAAHFAGEEDEPLRAALSSASLPDRAAGPGGRRRAGRSGPVRLAAPPGRGASARPRRARAAAPHRAGRRRRPGRRRRRGGAADRRQPPPRRLPGAAAGRAATFPPRSRTASSGPSPPRLRTYLIARHDVAPAAADGAVTAATAALLGRYDEGAGAEALARRLALRLEERAGSTTPCSSGRRRGRACRSSSPASRCAPGSSPRPCGSCFPTPSGRGPAIVLRAARRRSARPRPRSCSTSPDARRRSAPSSTSTTRSIRSEARHHILLWRLDPAYRAAVARLAS